MDRDRDLIEAADRNFIGSYRKLVEHIPGSEAREFGGIFAFATGLPIGMFNGVIVAAPATGRNLTAALDWIDDRDVPHRLWIHEELTDHLAQTAQGRGIEQDPWLMPQMILQPAPELPPPAPGVSLAAVSDGRSLDEYRSIYVEGGMSEDVARRLFAASFAADSDVELVVASLDDRPIGTSLAIRTGGVAGVYAVATLVGARRRGVGTAATWAAVAAGQAWGCDTIVLQASEMGLPMYQQMGFRTIVRYAVFGPLAKPSSAPREQPRGGR